MDYTSSFGTRFFCQPLFQSHILAEIIILIKESIWLKAELALQYLSWTSYYNRHSLFWLHLLKLALNEHAT